MCHQANDCRARPWRVVRGRVVNASTRLSPTTVRAVRQQLGRDVTTVRFVAAVVLSRLDYCNALLAGLPASTLAHLQTGASNPTLWLGDQPPHLIRRGTLLLLGPNMKDDLTLIGPVWTVSRHH